jgi:hypothetical protein
MLANIGNASTCHTEEENLESVKGGIHYDCVS